MPPNSVIVDSAQKENYTCIRFNNPVGWTAVDAHLLACMKRAGYKSSVSDAATKEMGPYRSIYSKPGSKLVVEWEYTGANWSQSGGHKITDIGEFRLMITYIDK